MSDDIERLRDALASAIKAEWFEIIPLSGGVADDEYAEHAAAVADRLVRGPEVASLLAEVRDLRESLDHVDRWIIAHAPIGVVIDHACRKCIPLGPLVTDDFLCAVHEAMARAESDSVA